MKHVLMSLTTALTFGIAAGSAHAADLKLADFQPAGHPFVEKVYKPMGQEVSDATDGTVTIKVYPGGELGAGPAEQYSRVVNGVTEIAFGLPGYTAANFPKTLLTELPGVLYTQTGTDRILANLDALAQDYRRVALLGLWTNAPNLLLMGDKEVRSPDDLKGMKIRVPSRNAGLVVEAWGATPVSMPAPEIYSSIQTGVIDGAVIDATTLRTFKLKEVTNVVVQGMKPTISTFFLIMNRDAYADLPEAAQSALREAGRKASVAANSIQLAGAAAALEDFASLEGKTVITLTPEEAAAFDAASATVTASVIGEGDSAGLDASGYVAALSQ